MSTPTRLPAVFLGHGSPMNALEHNRWTEAWAGFAARTSRPEAILAVSAHWYTDGTAVTAMERPRTIHDFTGFPQALFDVQYPCPGSPALAARVAEVLAPVPVAMDHDWGLDHGAWSLLAHLYPEADVPVVQLSIDATRPLEDHIAMGRALAPLRDEGVLVLASGDLVHNLRAMDWGAAEQGSDWANAFDRAATEILTTRPADLPTLTGHPDYRAAVPTPDHFLPACYLAGLADAAGRGCEVLVEGVAYGSVSMTSYVLP